ncbi:hypothetical protein BLOT_003379 [Blomia tropicalis]|nr:hypothetical protein BLOT_003379 [Blomia tropicalis]
MPNDPLRATHSIISKPLSSTSQPHPFQTGTTTTLLSQSNSFHTFQQPTINLSSYTFAKPIQSSSSSATTNRQLNSSRSSNCLSDGLIEDEEFIDKLFPKCRPKAKISNVNHHHNNNNTSIGNKSGNNNVAINSYDHNIVDSLPSNKMHSPQPPPSPTPPPAPTLAPSSSITNEQSNLNEIDQQQQQHRTGSKTRKVSSSSSTSTSGNIPQSHLTPLGLQSRRLWNFMDISPSPSPPPLSPIEMTSTQTDSLYDAIINYNNNNNNERISPTVGETVNYPQPTRRDSLHNKTSNNNNNNNRYDINSYELNRSTTTTTGNVNIEETKTNDEWDSSNDDCLMNESATINNMNRTIKSKQMGAHYRLDSLLSHSEENPLSTSMGNHNKPKSTMINGIKKSNRISLEPIVSNIFTDLNDDDDVLFSRIGPDNNINKSTKMKYLNEDPNNDDGDEDTEEEVAIGIRNRIEMAGGRELFSSSRGTRSKRRSNSTNNNNNNSSNNNNNFKYNSGKSIVQL